ncbi:cytochrome P450 [Mycena floridula]|nr:cytochrome P450 [Mycena floridula]
MVLTSVDAGLLALTILLLWLVSTRSRTRNPLPPGPRGYPIIGNLFDFPSSTDWTTAVTHWGTKWGEITSISTFGSTLIVINSYSKAIELMEKKGSIYSDRPHLAMAMDLVDMKGSISFLQPYDKRFKSSRRIFHRELGSSNINSFFAQQETVTKRFIKRLLVSPTEDLFEHCLWHAGSMILKAAYGYDIQESGDTFVKIANKAMENFNKSTAPGAFLVNQFPILVEVPDWFPGAGFKRLGKSWAKDYWAMLNIPFNYVKRQMEEGTAQDSFTARWLSRNLSKELELDLKGTSGAMFGAGVETTAVSFHAFYLTMCQYPEMQKKAQAEIDSVVGRDRLPTFRDRESLPYVEALCLEVSRYHAPVPNGFPHCSSQDDAHDGYFIPAGSVIMPNIWYMAHDPKVYKNPMEFKPTRFLGDNPEQNPREYIWGFGKRICPGRPLADASIYITVVTSLAVFDIKPIGETPALETTNSGVVSKIKPFGYELSPRINMQKLEAWLE